MMWGHVAPLKRRKPETYHLLTQTFKLCRSKPLQHLCRSLKETQNGRNFLVQQRLSATEFAYLPAASFIEGVRHFGVMCLRTIGASMKGSLHEGAVGSWVRFGTSDYANPTPSLAMCSALQMHHKPTVASFQAQAFHQVI